MAIFLKRLAQLRALSIAERIALVRALLLLPTLALTLRCVGYRRTLALVQGRARESRAGVPSAAPSAAQLSELALLSRMIATASNHGLHRGTCLTRSLTLLRMMRRAGCSGRLVIGARTDRETFGAHAWVECGGIVVNDGPDVAERFGELSASSAR